MWHTWLQTKPPPGRPRCWWSQLERETRTGLPFAHLFPRPPTSGGPEATEAQRLVRALRLDSSPQDGRILTQTEIPTPPPPALPPPAASAAGPAWSHQAAEPERWGPDGALVVAWFEQGEAEAQAPGHEEALEAGPAPRGFPGLLAWLRRPWQRSEPYEWAGAEL